jgi:hypothetical protein
MSTVRRQVGVARRRLNLNAFFRWSAIGVAAAAGVWILVILVERAFVLGIPLSLSVWGAAAIAAIIAVAGTLISRVDPVRAAIAIDTAAGLKERLSTAILVENQSDEFARAAVHDAERAAGRIHVPAHVPLRAPRNWPVSIATVAAALILLRFMPALELFKTSEAKAQSPEQAAKVEVERKVIQAEVDKQLARVKELAEDNPALKDLEKDLAPLELPESPTVTPEDIRREAVKKIDDVARKLEEKTEAGDFDLLKETMKMMQQIKPEQGSDPGSKLSDALSKGDVSAAKSALSDLQKQLEEAAQKADPEAKQKIEQMQQKIEKLAEQMAKLGDTTQIQKELENKGGLSEEEAKKLLEQLRKMDPKQLAKELQKQLGEKGVSPKQIEELAKKISQNKQAQQACKNMSQALAKAAQAMQQCNSPGAGSGAAQQASNAMSDAMSQLSEMEMAEQLMNELQAQLAQLQDLREGVCQGNCQGDGQGLRNNQIGNQGPNYGLGIGERIGREKAAHSLKPEKADVRMQGGQIIGQMLIDGPQLKGEAGAEVREAVAAAQRDAQDAIEKHAVQRQYERAVREYFDRLAGLAEQKQAADRAKADEKPKPDEKPK